MVTGSSIHYVAGGDVTDLPRPGDRPPVHRPWCCDCKRKHEATELDAAGRCSRCAHAAITRAEAAARRAADADAAAQVAELERRHQAEVNAEARRKAQPVCVPRPTPAPRRQSLGEHLRDLEQTDPKVAAATTYDDAVDRAARPDDHVVPENLTATPEADLDAQIQHVTGLLRATHGHPNYAVQVLRKNALSALEALHLIHEFTQTPGAATSTPAAPGPTAGHREGEARARRSPNNFEMFQKPRATRRDKIDLPADDVITAYRAGQSLGQIATTYGVSAPTVRRVLVDNNEPRRRSPVEHTPELIAEVRRLYDEDHLTQVEIAQRIGRSTKVVQNLMTAAGVDRRAAQARQAADNARGLKDRIAALSVTTAQLRAWARENGHNVPTRGLVARDVVEAYATAHPNPPQNPTTSTGDTAA